MPEWIVIPTSWDCSCLLKTKKRTSFYGAAGAANPFRCGVESLQTQIYWQEREETEETDWFVHWKTRCKQAAGARRQVKGSSWQTQQENPTNTRMPTVTRLSHPDLSWGLAARESLDSLAYSKNGTTWDRLRTWHPKLGISSSSVLPLSENSSKFGPLPLGWWRHHD